MPVLSIPEAEAALLSAFIRHKGCFAAHAHLLRPAYFAQDGNRIIAEEMQSMGAKGMELSAATLSARLRLSGKFDAAGGPGYIASLESTDTDPASASSLIALLAEAFRTRELSHIAQEMQHGGGTSEEIALKAEASIASLLSASGIKEPSPLSSVMGAALKQAESDMKSKGAVTGIPTGLGSLDWILKGWQPECLYIVGARPAMGKTAFLVNAVRNAGCPVLMFEAEMSESQIGYRMLVSEARVDSGKLKDGLLADDEFARLLPAADTLAKLPLYIDDTTTITLAELESKAVRYCRDFGVKMVVVDYLQLVKGAAKQSREQEVAAVSTGLKGLAKRLKIPVVALAQLSRDLEKRSDKRPMMSDLRESGSIEQDADCVMFLYRPEYYGIESDESGQSTHNLCEISVVKHRPGDTGNIACTFVKEMGLFQDGHTSAPYQRTAPPAGTAVAAYYGFPETSEPATWAAPPYEDEQGIPF